jgi:hypothetical protein
MNKKIKEDLTGKTFGSWTVLSFSHRDRHPNWRCQCDCGKIRNVVEGSLLRGLSRSCGHKRIKNRVGQTYGRLTVLEFSRVDEKGKTYWKCKCACGKVKIFYGGDLSWRCSCGCGSVKTRFKATHGRKNTPEWRSWCAMRGRCNSPTHKQYPHYGGRGIKVHTGWNDFMTFYKDMGDRPEGMSLDRIDVNGDYEPGNCRWATDKVQMNNRRPMRRIEDFSDAELIAELKRRKQSVLPNDYKRAA